MRKFAKRGMDVPALRRKPTLLDAAHFYWRAFEDLNPRREWSNGVPRLIQLSEIVAYLDLIGWTDTEARLTFLEIISQLDMKWLEIRPKPAPPPQSPTDPQGESTDGNPPGRNRRRPREVGRKRG